MIKRIAVTIFLVLVLAACGQVKADVPDTPDALATQVLVEKYMAATLNKDADSLMALYAEDALWMDYGGNLGPVTKGNLDYAVRHWDYGQDPNTKYESYIITPDGRFAVINDIESGVAALSGKKVSTPRVGILEFKHGKIISETWYYNGYIFH